MLLRWAAAGSVTPVEPGRMRNSWYPRQKAEYVTLSTLEGVKIQDLTAERDFAFGMRPQQPLIAKEVETRSFVRDFQPLQPKSLPVGILPSLSWRETKLTCN